MEKERADLIKKIHDLGFEVGIKSHSEIGWVLREYNTLVENARKVGIRSPESYYQDGKIKGKASRDKNSEVKEKNTDVEKSITVSEIKNDAGEIEEFEILELHRKPGLNELPNLVKQIRHTEVPGLFEGFKPLRSAIFRH